jgi:hypothetical protein
MVLPQFDPGMGIVAEFIKFRKRRTVLGGHQHGCAGVAQTDRLDLGRIDPGILDGLGNAMLEAGNIVVRILQCVVRRQFGITQFANNHGTGVIQDRRPQFFSVISIDNNGTPRKCAEIHSNDIAHLGGSSASGKHINPGYTTCTHGQLHPKIWFSSLAWCMSADSSVTHTPTHAKESRCHS